MRHFNPIGLPRLPAPPTDLQPDVSALYAAPEGHLQVAGPEGAPRTVIAAGRAVTAADVPMNALAPDLIPIPGMSVNVGPGFHRFSAAVRMTSQSGFAAFTSIGLHGPAMTSVIGMTHIHYTTDLGSMGYDFWYQPWWEDPLISLRFGVVRWYALEGVLAMSEPGEVGLMAGVLLSRRVGSYDGTDTWQEVTGGTGEVTSEQAHGGSNSFKITATGGAAAFTEQSWTVSGGFEHRMTAWCYSPTGSPSAGVTLIFVDESGEQVGSAAVYEPLPASEWTQRTLTYTPPLNAATVYARVGLETDNGGAAPGEVVYIDDILLEQTTGGDFTVLAGSSFSIQPF